MQIKSRALVCLLFLSMGSAFAAPNAPTATTLVDPLGKVRQTDTGVFNAPAFNSAMTHVKLIPPIVKDAAKPVQTATVDWDGYWDCMWSVILGGPFAALYCKLAYTY